VLADKAYDGNAIRDLIEGQDTLPTAPIERWALLRLNGDLYESTIDALTALYDKLSVGGYLIVDDYNSWPGCKLAVDEFRKTSELKDPIVDIDHHSIFLETRDLKPSSVVC
jgi:O-methyltransferase